MIIIFPLLLFFSIFCFSEADLIQFTTVSLRFQQHNREK